MDKIKVFAINPGSTSTKIALFEDENKLFSANVSHDSAELGKFENISDQLEYRKTTIMYLLNENNISLEGVDAFVGRGGGLLPLEGGTYEIDEVMLDHASRGANGIQHPAQLGSQLANQFCQEFGGRGFVVNPPDVDELQDVARITGVKGVYRSVHLHALNLKETAIRHSELVGKKYNEVNYVVCHIGGGISVSAHSNGKMIDGFDNVGGEGAMAPTRCGAVSVMNVLNYLKDNNLDVAKAKELCTKNGGFVSYFDNSDAKEIFERGEAGDENAKIVWDAMIYQINKCIGAMATVLGGKVDGILLGGGMVYNDNLVSSIKEKCEWIAPVFSYPGEFEMEAMSSGARRVILGSEVAKKYTGKAVWKGLTFNE